jgi:hypothetical protein
MIELVTHRFLGFSRKEVWFYSSEKIKKGTYTVFCFTEEKDAHTKKNVLVQNTSLISLEQDEQKLFEDIHRTTQRHIRKAEKLGIETRIDFNPSTQKSKNVINDFAVFARKKSIEWNSNRIYALQKSGRLIITEAFLQNELLVTHVYLHDTRQVVLLHSYPARENRETHLLRGYANKYLHWKDLVELRKQGLKIYDFGGVDLEKHPGISAFKRSFGGMPMYRYSYIESSRLFYFLVNLLRKAIS